MLVWNKMEELDRVDQLDAYIQLTIAHENQFGFSISSSSPSSLEFAQS